MAGACVGVEGTDEFSCGACNAGYEGVYCSDCVEGYARVSSTAV
jgi:hypothetical protein